MIFHRHFTPGALWVHLVDNGAALATLVKGSSSALSGERIITYTHSKVAQSGVWAWVDRVYLLLCALDLFYVLRHWGTWRPGGVHAHCCCGLQLGSLISHYGFVLIVRFSAQNITLMVNAYISGGSLGGLCPFGPCASVVEAVLWTSLSPSQLSCFSSALDIMSDLQELRSGTLPAS